MSAIARFALLEGVASRSRESCGDHGSEDDGVYDVDGNYRCRDCKDDFAQCEECLEYHSGTDLNEYDLCESCEDENYTECEMCAERIHFSDCREHHTTGAPLCADCHDSIEEAI